MKNHAQVEIMELLDIIENAKLKDIFVKMLCTNPKERIQNASELIKKLESINLCNISVIIQRFT